MQKKQGTKLGMHLGHQAPRPNAEQVADTSPVERGTLTNMWHHWADRPSMMGNAQREGHPEGIPKPIPSMLFDSPGAGSGGRVPPAIIPHIHVVPD